MSEIALIYKMHHESIRTQLFIQAMIMIILKRSWCLWFGVSKTLRALDTTRFTPVCIETCVVRRCRPACISHGWFLSSHCWRGEQVSFTNLRRNQPCFFQQKFTCGILSQSCLRQISMFRCIEAKLFRLERFLIYE